MFKRVEKKRKRREEEEEIGLDQDTRGIMGLNDTDSDESDSGSEQDPGAQSDDLDAVVGEDNNQEMDVASEDEGVNEYPPISVAEALKDPLYLISLDPTVHGCVLCKGKLIKSAGMAITHRNASAHKRRFEHFKLLAVDEDPRHNAWELVEAVRPAPNVHSKESRELSKRALKRQVKQTAIRQKRKRHKELKAKAVAKKALKKLSTADQTTPAAPSKASLRSSPALQNRSGRTPKKHKLQSNNLASTIVEPQDVTAKLASRTMTSSDGKKSVLKSKLKSIGKANKLS